MSEKHDEEQRKLAGFFKQILIVSWKNLLLYKSNVAGIICEFLFPCLFVAAQVFVLRVGIDILIDNVTPRNRDPYVIEQNTNFIYDYDDFGVSELYYYPDNSFVKSIINDAVGTNKDYYQATGLNITNPDEYFMNSTAKNVVFVSFNESYTSWSSLPSSIEYTIYSSK
jgi:hypothetical protein